LRFLLLLLCCANAAIAAATLQKLNARARKHAMRAAMQANLFYRFIAFTLLRPCAHRHAAGGGYGAKGDSCNALLALLTEAAAAAASAQPCVVARAAVTNLLQVALHRCFNVARAALAP